MKAELNVDVEKVVKDIAEAAMVESLAKNGGKIVEQIVKQALFMETGSFPKKTVLQLALEKAIKESALKEVGAWLDANKEQVRVSVTKYITETLTPQFVGSKILQCLNDIKIAIKPFTGTAMPIGTIEEEDV